MNARTVRHLLFKKYPGATIPEIPEDEELAWGFVAAAIDGNPQTTRLDDNFLANHTEAVAQKMKELLRQPQPTEVAEVDPAQVLGLQNQVGMQCSRCKQKDVKYVLVQTRSADEGMTADCECRRCGFRFRLSV